MPELTSAVRAFLEERRFGVFATIKTDGTPQLTTMWYLLEGDRIMMNTLVGRKKERNLRNDPRIVICIEDEYHYVTITGRAELDYDDERAQAGIRALAIRYEGEEGGQRMVERTFHGQARVNIHMTIESIDAHGI